MLMLGGWVDKKIAGHIGAQLKVFNEVKTSITNVVPLSLLYNINDLSGLFALSMSINEHYCYNCVC